MKSVDVKSITYIDPKFKIGDIVRISKYKNIFAEGFVPNWSEEVFVIEKVKNTVLWTTFLVILKAKKSLELFMKKNYEKQIKKSLELKR